VNWLTENWSTLISNAAFVALVGGLYKLWRNWQALRSSRPRVMAETEQIGIGSQTQVIMNLNNEIRRLSRGYDNLVRYTRRTSSWHVRHLPFDVKAKEVIGEIAPDQVEKLPRIEPFPVFTEEDEADSQDQASV
jgi:hypothetical protein